MAAAPEARAPASSERRLMKASGGVISDGAIPGLSRRFIEFSDYPRLSNIRLQKDASGAFCPLIRPADSTNDRYCPGGKVAPFALAPASIRDDTGTRGRRPRRPGCIDEARLV